MFYKPFLTEVHEKIRYNWVREPVKLEVIWSFVNFSNGKKNFLDESEVFKYYSHDVRESSKSFLK